jgi:serine/threonine-protein kinase PknG
MSATVTGSPPRGQAASHRRVPGGQATFAGFSPAQRIVALTLAVSGDATIPHEVTESAETRLALARGPGGADAAQGAFSAVFDDLPGELAPKLALAFAAEAAGDLTTAGRYFRLVWTVPATSSHHAAAQIAAVRILVSSDGPGVTGDDLRQAGSQLGQLIVDDVRRQQLTVEILRAALDWCTSGQPAGGGPVLGCEPNARAVRFGLERSYRALARLTPDAARRVELVDMANAIRPRTLT